MIKEITSWRHILGFQKSKRYLNYMKRKFPRGDLHHILGSTTGLKYTDYLIVPIDHNFHLSVVEKNKGLYFEKFLPEAISYLYGYAINELKFSKEEIYLFTAEMSPNSINQLIKLIKEKENV